MRCAKCGSYAVNLDGERKLCDVCYYKQPLLELLQLINGSDYTEKYGLQESVTKAREALADSADSAKARETAVDPVAKSYIVTYNPYRIV